MTEELKQELNTVYQAHGKNILGHEELSKAGFTDPATLVATGVLKRSAGNGFSRNWAFIKSNNRHYEGFHRK